MTATDRDQSGAKAERDVGVNRLLSETSPYLLEHARNPVHWYPWGSEAFAAARRLDRPIFLSIGYSACHWCHVMAHESFENPQTAALLNEHVVAIKVDRDERPDLDRVYMNAVQAMTGSGGWPMSVFLTPDLQPLFGGTYFPPEDRHGLPGFPRVIKEVAAFWRERRDDALKSAASLAAALCAPATATASGPVADGDTSRRRALQALVASADGEWGGFGRAPKFPPATVLAFLLAHRPALADSRVADIVERTLEAMADGGIRDHVGGGFHRYAVDRHWLVPHFEKMLTDNALLATVYLDAFLRTGEPRWREVCVGTLDYVLRDMTSAGGAFHASEDADSEGEEGRFYVWDKSAVVALLGKAESDLFCMRYGVSEQGNFEGHTILHAAVPVADAARRTGLSVAEAEVRLNAQLDILRLAREKRPRPGRDETVIAAWNALMVTALARAGQALGIERYREAAVRAGNFFRTDMLQDGRLRHNWRGDEPAATPHVPGFLDDYALVANAFLDLYETSFDASWFRDALDLAGTMVAEFRDPDGDGFFFSAAAHRTPLARDKPFIDHPVPSGNSAAARLLFRLGLFTGDAAWTSLGEGVMRAASGVLEQFPSEAPCLLGAGAFVWDRPVEVAVIGSFADSRTVALLAAVRKALPPAAVLAALAPEASDADASRRLVPLLDGRGLANGVPCAYVCCGFACHEPTCDPAVVGRMLAGDETGA